MKKKTQIIFGVFFSIIVLVGLAVVLINADTLFSNKVVVTYGDGCIEEFINNELVTPMCVEGRALEATPPNDYQNIPPFTVDNNMIPLPILEFNDTDDIQQINYIVNVTRINETSVNILRNITITGKFDDVCFRRCIDRSVNDCVRRIPFDVNIDMYIFNISLNMTEEDAESYCTFDAVDNRTEVCTERCQ